MAYPVSDATLEALKAHLTPCRFPKRGRMVEAGAYCHSAYFIEKGITRSFWLVEALEEVVAYRIAISDLRRLIETNLELCNWWRIIHQDEYRRLHRSHKERLTLPARERYEAFRKQFPEVCRRVNLGYIASYLGITLSTLSRLRGNG